MASRIKRVFSGCLAWLFLSMLFSPVFAQTESEHGLPTIRNYLPREYGADIQNWAIIQDDRGIMYIGNNIGVLEYDGVTWRLIRLPNRSVARSFAKDKEGRIYVGGVNELGYLEPDSTGRLGFHSLLSHIPASCLPFGDVWQSINTPDGIYFLTFQYLFRWSPETGEMKVWQSSTSFHSSFYVNDTFYLRQWDVGLVELKGDSLVLIPGGEQFADERIYIMLPFPEGGTPGASGTSNRILVVTRTRGMFLFDGTSFTPFRTEADDFIRRELSYAPGLVLRDGRIVINTITGGAAIIDHEGRLLQIIDKSTGLQNNSILYLYQDRSGGLWMGLDNGVARVEVASNFTRFDTRNGLPSGGYRFKRHKGILYASTTVGLYALDPETSVFNEIEGIQSQVFGMISFGDQLLAATTDGIFVVENRRAIPVRASVNKDFEGFDFHRSKLDSNRVYTSLSDGVASLYWNGSRWIDEGRIPGITDETRSIYEMEDGSLWVGTGARGVLHVSFDGDTNDPPQLRQPVIEHFDTRAGLPPGGVLSVSLVDRLHFITQEGVYRYDEASRRFSVDSTFMIVSELGSIDTGSLVEDADGRVWISFGRDIAVGDRQTDGSYAWTTAPFVRFADEIVQTVYPDENGIVWFGTANGAIRYDTRMENGEGASFAALIRRVTRGARTSLFEGASLPGASQVPVRLPSDGQSLRFEFAAPTYEADGHGQFRTFLEGFDTEWTDWSPDHSKEYTNLRPGDYRFRVQARNVDQWESAEAVYAFTIAPPWFRTWWAYLLYAAGAAVLALGFVRARTYQLQQRGKLLERIIRERTAELHQKNRQLENQKEDIERLSRIGRDITATLSIESIIDTVYENVNALMDAAVFSIGLYNPEKNCLELPASREKGERLPYHSYDLNDKNRLAVWCFKNQREVLINDYQTEYANYIPELKAPLAGETPSSILYLPLTYKDKTNGVITAQSFRKNAYNEFHLNMLRNLAIYTAIALDNAEAYHRLNLVLDDLKNTQERLVTQSKLAALGALTAGIAHEIKNPLNFINNYAELSVGLAEEIRALLAEQSDRLDADVVENLNSQLDVLVRNTGKIRDHGKRADNIVRSMLQHSRGKAGERQPTDINLMVEEDLNLAYHGMRAQDSSFNVKVEAEYDPAVGKLDVVPQDVSRALLNIITNACYEVHKRKLAENGAFTPRLVVSTKRLNGQVEIRIRDNGQGIPEAIRDRILVPFFTTKPTGQGTGLGLSISNDIIVHGHGGQLQFESEEGQGTEFIVRLPASSTD